MVRSESNRKCSKTRMNRTFGENNTKHVPSTKKKSIVLKTQFKYIEIQMKIEIILNGSRCFTAIEIGRIISFVYSHKLRCFDHIMAEV